MNNCEHKNIKVTEQTFSNGTIHNAKRCEDCGRHLGYAPRVQVEDSLLYFGKYKGEKILEVAEKDPEYLEWLFEQDWCKPRMRDLIEQALAKV